MKCEKEDPFRVGVIVGSGIGSLQAVRSSIRKIQEKGPGRVNPLMVPMMISNMAAGNVSIQLGLKGKCTNVVTACATGTNCIGDALRAIQYGDADVMLAGGTESCICPTGVAGFTALTALTTSEDPMTCIRFHLTKTEVDLFLEKVPVWLFWKSWSMQSKRRKYLCRTCRIRCNGRCLPYYFSGRRRKRCGKGDGACDGRGRSRRRKKCSTSMHTEPAHITMICSRPMRSKGIWRCGKRCGCQFDKIHDRPSAWCGRRCGIYRCVKSIQDGFIHQTVGTRELG